VRAGEDNLPTRRILRVTLLALTLSLLVALLTAGSAHAADPGQEAPQGTSGDTSAEAPAGAAPAAPASEEPAQAAPPAEAPASAQPEVPAVEVPAETVQAPPVVPVEVKVEVPVLEVPVEAVPAAPVVEAPVQAPAASPVLAEAAEAVQVPPVAQENPKAQEETVTPRDAEGSPAASDGASQAVVSSVTAEATAPLGQSAPFDSIASASAGESQATTPSGSVPGLPSPSVQSTEAHRAEAFACALSSMGGSLGGICSVSSERARLLSGPSFGLVEVADRSASETASAPSAVSHSPVAVATPPINPAPSPAPSGASGAAAGGSGIAPVGFFNLSGLLRMGAPRAMRRLRLSFRPRTTACFALIPERPG
jgi:nicotinate-nucleotide--dimethylbenzimidazole phosphoribosyltransferase